MYNLFIFIYYTAALIVAIFSKKVRTMISGQHQAFSTIKRSIKKGDRVVWFHAASLGEFEQGRPLMERLRQKSPEVKILLTFFSPSGYEVRKNYEGADVVCYLPFDTPLNAWRLVRLVRPEAAYFIKYEFWMNYFHQLHRKGVPLYSVSSIFRHKQFFFRRWNLGYSRVLHYVTHFYVQNEESMALLASRGIECVSVVGDTRFDRVVDIQRQAKSVPAIDAWSQQIQTAGESLTMVCGSTWPPDEDLITDYFNTHPTLRLILAPHVVSEEHLAQIERKLQRPHIRLSQLMAGQATDVNPDAIIVDSYGLLSTIYRYGQMAYVGGGFGVGIHNVPEAAVYGLPVIIGPKNKKFMEAQALLRCGGALQVDGKKAFTTIMDRLMTDADYRQHAGSQSQHYISTHAGAADRIATDTMA